MILTIDGPAGTGKSTVAQLVARRLSFDFLDTGAMYRAVGLAALRRSCDLSDARELTFVARHARIEFDWAQWPPGVLLNGEPVGHLLRGSQATRAASFVAAIPAIREQLVAQQRLIGRERTNLVSEGRDQGSVVFPDAELKFYLDAAPAERARRRAAQLRARGEIVDMDALLREITDRDARDKGRAVGALTVPEGAEIIDTTLLSQDAVIEQIISRAEALAQK
jgi:cytidylate kinase